MQNNETKWEEERQSANNLAELFFRDIDYGKKDKRNQEEVKDEVIKSASNLIFYKLKEVYQKGKEEGLGEQLSQTKSITTKYEIPSIILEEFKNKTRLQTLEKMERVIKKLIENERDNGFEYINGEVLLQTLNKMKEK